MRLLLLGVFFLNFGCNFSAPETETISSSTSSTDETTTPNDSSTAPACEKSVLFVGNSFIFYNDLPKILESLAKALGQNLCTDSVVEGGSNLSYLLDDKRAIAQSFKEKLKKNWDMIIFQEQSFIPAIKNMREQSMYPALRKLVTMIDKAKPMLFMTWAYKDGVKDDAGSFGTFEEMQSAISEGYEQIAKELSIEVVPVGQAFLKAKQQGIELWDQDKKHPSLAGSYLSACVFYAVIFNKSPESDYFAGLPKDSATFLQKTAKDLILKP